MNLELLNHPLAQEAAKFAALHHAKVGQLRKYTSQPYIVHPSEVAAQVSGASDADSVMVAAAYLHDVMEDTDCTFAELDAAFPPTVVEYVLWLTEGHGEPDYPNWTREMRKNYDLVRLSRAPEKVKTIKICDLISNTSTIAAYSAPDYALKYLGEKRLLLDNALRSGDNTLWIEASVIANNSIMRLRASMTNGVGVRMEGV